MKSRGAQALPVAEEGAASRLLRNWNEHRSVEESALGRRQDFVRKLPRPDEDMAEVASDGEEDGVGGVTGATFEIATPEVTVVLHLADCGSASQLAFEGTEHTALLV
jgi:hypothetical protein